MGRPPNRTIKVHVMNDAARGYVMWWREPISRKKRKKTPVSQNYKDVLREAAALEIELRSSAPGSTEGWTAFRLAIEERYYPHVGDETRALSRQVLSRWEKSIGVIGDLAEIGPSHIAIFESAITSPSVQTKGKYLRQLKVLFNWGQRQGFLTRVPHIELPRQLKGFAGKGSPKSDKEITSLLEGIKTLVGATAYPDWEDCIYASIHSGLRIGEVLKLTWNRLQILPSGAVLIVWGHGDQKSKKAETTATVPQFAALVKRKASSSSSSIKPTDRVFCPRTFNGFYVSKEDFAKKLKEASGGAILPHDLRRTFADRWSRLMMPADLSRVMRCGINTIMKFYAKGDSEDLAVDLMRRFGGDDAIPDVTQKGP